MGKRLHRLEKRRYRCFLFGLRETNGPARFPVNRDGGYGSPFCKEGPGVVPFHTLKRLLFRFSPEEPRYRVGGDAVGNHVFAVELLVVD